jgi:hypothetical protein
VRITIVASPSGDPDEFPDNAQKGMTRTFIVRTAG